MPVFEAFTIQGQYYWNRRYQCTLTHLVHPLHVISHKTDYEQTISVGDNIQGKILM